MATIAANVNVAVTGGVYYGPTSTPLPASPSAALNAGFLDCGYIGEDGITQTVGDTTTEIRAWQNSDVVRRIQTDHSAQFKLTLLENNANTLAAYFGGNYTAGVGKIQSGVLPRKAWVFHIIDGTSLVRVVVPDGQIVERGDVVYKNGEAIGYPITIECYPDVNGVKAFVYYATATVSA
jgi:hypothetical protein